MYNRITHLIGVETGITYVFSQNYASIKVDPYDSLAQLAFHNFVILIKPVLWKN